MREFLRKCQLIGVMALGLLPLPVILLGYFCEGLLPFAWVFPAGFAAVAVIALTLRGKWRLVFGVLSAAAGLVISALVPEERLFALLCAVLFTGPLLWSLQLGGWSHDEELPVFWYIAGLFAHLAMQLVLFWELVEGTTVYDGWEPWLLVCFFAFAGLSMLSMNRGSLALAPGGWRQGASEGMRRKNRVLTLLLFAIPLVLCLLPPVVEAVSGVAARLLVMLLQAIAMALKNSMEDPGQGSTLPPGQNNQYLPSGGETGELVKLLEPVGYVLGIVLTAVVLVLGAVWFFKKAGKLLPMLSELLGRYAASATEDYEDEVTATRDVTAPEHARRERGYSRRRAQPKSLSPTEQVRWRYRWLLGKNRQWKSGSTARENIPEDAAKVYEQARYSGRPITEKDAADFAAKTKRI